MYKIGEFSKITSLTVKALRYYDEQEILKPSCRTDNHYRMYSEDDFEKAKVIILLRRLNFTIAEIKDVLANCKDDSDLAYFLTEKKSLIEKSIIKEKALIKEIDLLIAPNKKIMEENIMSYEFEIKNIPRVKVISIRYQGGYADVGNYIGTLYKAAKNQVDGEPFNLYYDEDYKEIADIEICLPVKKAISCSGVNYKELPAIKALCTTHVGSYETLNRAYKLIIDYSKQQGMTLITPSREIYRNGPGMIFKGNPQKYITEIVIPIQ